MEITVLHSFDNAPFYIARMDLDWPYWNCGKTLIEFLNVVQKVETSLQ